MIKVVVRNARLHHLRGDKIFTKKIIL